MVNNDYYQSAYERCATSSVLLQAGNHTLYVEGWSATAMLSITATFQGPDTLNMPFAIPGPTPCLPFAPSAEDGKMVICGYNAVISIDLGAIWEFYYYFNQVCKDFFDLLIFSVEKHDCRGC